jgi:hypothetical protein
MLITTRANISRSKSLAPGSPPSRPLRAASGGGLRPALTAAATRRNGQPSGRKNHHEPFVLDTNDQGKNMP